MNSVGSERPAASVGDRARSAVVRRSEAEAPLLCERGRSRRIESGAMREQLFKEFPAAAAFR